MVKTSKPIPLPRHFAKNPVQRIFQLKTKKQMERLFIKRNEVMKITGWGRTKSTENLATIRFNYAYSPIRKDVLITDFCDYNQLKVKDVLKAMESFCGT